MTLSAVWRALPLVAALTAISCSGEPEEALSEPVPVSQSTSSAELTSTNKVLILGSSVSNGLSSREAKTVAAYMPTWQVEVVTPQQWKAMTAEQFMTYRTIIIGDAACESGEAAFQAAVENRTNWGAVVDGRVAILSTNPVSNSTPQLVENALKFVLGTIQRRTGMYISLGCAYQSAPADTTVELLEPFGSFKVQGVSGCASSGHMFKMSSTALTGTLSDSSLSGSGGCVARSVFTSYPDRTFSFATLAVSTTERPVPGAQSYTEFAPQEQTYVGAPYMLVRGSMAKSAGCGVADYIPSAEECDMGEGVNGTPAVANQDPLTTCSFSCHFNWCGDGVVDTLFGEECDNGVYNGRSNDVVGDIGACTSFCKNANIQAPNSPPTALCRNATVVAEYTCGVQAGIDNGSYDPDGEPVKCVQSPAGPYTIGNTTVTLTCSDPGGRQSSCTGVVTVVDNVAPTVALVGEAHQSLECIRSAGYSDPGATAQDLCSGPLPSNSISRSGTVGMGTPNTYSLEYVATDPAGNKSSPVTRTVVISDTLPPSLSLSGLANMGLECGNAFSDPGVSAIDQCAGILNSAIQKTGTVNSSAPGTYVLRYNVKDPANFAAPEVSRTVTVSDTRKPVVTISGPLSVPVECGSTYTDPGATAADQCAGPLPAVANGTVDAKKPGAYTIGYSAKDPSGNVGVSAGNRTVTVSDTLPPVLTIYGSAKHHLECGTPYTDPGAMANDQCAGGLPVTQSGSVDSKVLGTQTITYSASDAHGHVASATRSVTVSDSLVPSISVSGPLEVAHECGSTYVDPGAKAADACAGDLTGFIQATQAGNPNQPGSVSISYSVTDPSGNMAVSSVSRTVHVQDTLPPTLALMGPATQALECGTPYTEPGATAMDACFGDLTGAITRSGSANTGAPSTYTLVYNVTDPAGRSAPAVSRTVHVVDTQAPVITLQGPASSTLECGFSYVDPGAKATDACSGEQGILISGSVNPNAPGSYTLNYTAMDSSGNSASANRTVAVQDTLAPQVKVRQGPSLIQCNGAPYVDPGATAWDLCGGDLTAKVTSTSNLDQSREGQYTVTYSVKDAAGHVGTNTRTLTVGPCSTTCVNVHLNDYNLFLLGDYNGGHDVVGKVAAGGNITMTDFAVGSGLPDNAISNTLVAGGNLTLSRGAVWGDAFYGGTYSTDPSVVFPRGTAAKGTPIDFAARFAELRSLSSHLASKPANGTTTREVWGGVMLRGTNPGVNVFDVDASAFNGAVLWSIDAPAGSFVVVNIHGASANFGGFGISFSGGIDQHGVLYNFVDATSITAQGFGFWGTVLAPFADVQFSNGSWDGGIYAKSLTGNAEGHINPLNDREICQ